MNEIQIKNRRTLAKTIFNRAKLQGIYLSYSYIEDINLNNDVF